jgi:hypothetical protein
LRDRGRSGQGQQKVAVATDVPEQPAWPLGVENQSVVILVGLACCDTGTQAALVFHACQTGNAPTAIWPSGQLTALWSELPLLLVPETNGPTV